MSFTTLGTCACQSLFWWPSSPPHLRLAYISSPQLGRSTGPALLLLCLDLLRRLVLHCEQLDTQNRLKYEAAQAETDLFLDMESMASLELANDQVLLPSVPGSPVSLCPKSHRCGLSLHFWLNAHAYVVET